MKSVYCFRCLHICFSPDEVRCRHCGNDETSKCRITWNYQPVVSESGKVRTRVSVKSYILLSDASTQTTKSDFRLLKTFRNASTQTTDSDSSFLAEVNEWDGYVDEKKSICFTQVRSSEIFDQNSDENLNLFPDNNKDDFYDTNIDRSNKATQGPLLKSMIGAHVAPKQRTCLDELSQSDERRNIPNNDKMFIKERTECTEQVNVAGKLNFAGSIHLPEYSCPNTYPENCINVELEDTEETSVSSLVLPGETSNASSSNLVPGNEGATTSIQELNVDNSGKSRRSIFKQKMPVRHSLTCRKCGKTFFKESILKLHVENNCDLNSDTSSQTLQIAPKHLQTEVPVTDSLTCGKCGKTFRRETVFKLHVESNCDPNPFQCDQCDEKFPYQSNLLMHQLLHSAERPFKCDQCPYACKRKHDLKKHQKRCYERILLSLENLHLH